MEEKLIDNSIVVIVVGTISLITFIVGILVFVILYQKKITKAAQEKQELENKYQKELLSSFIETQEKERHRIAADLHDGVGASLAAIKLMISRISGKTDEEKQLISDCTEAIQNTASSVRQISHNLLPPSLETLGLSKVLERMSKNFSSDKLQVSFDSELRSALDKKTELAFFRIAQEMINNTIKHANATEIDILLVENDEAVFFKYTDNGRGFEIDKTDGLGLRNIKSRIQMIDAEYNFFSDANQKSGIQIKKLKS